jgi:hypothetical protein
MNITFDTNCLIDLELCESAADNLRNIVIAHNAGQLTISVPGISASERHKDGIFANNFSLFQQRLGKLSEREFEILKPPAYYDLVYFDWAIFGSDETIKLERQIHEILHPEIQFEWEKHAEMNNLDPNHLGVESDKEWHKWRNRKCDTLALWCHIYYGKDIFVTRDKNFHKITKKTALESLGAKHIFYPDDVKL